MRKIQGYDLARNTKIKLMVMGASLLTLAASVPSAEARVKGCSGADSIVNVPAQLLSAVPLSASRVMFTATLPSDELSRAALNYGMGLAMHLDIATPGSTTERTPDMLLRQDGRLDALGYYAMSVQNGVFTGYIESGALKPGAEHSISIVTENPSPMGICARATSASIKVQMPSAISDSAPAINDPNIRALNSLVLDVPYTNVSVSVRAKSAAGMDRLEVYVDGKLHNTTRWGGPIGSTYVNPNVYTSSLIEGYQTQLSESDLGTVFWSSFIITKEESAIPIHDYEIKAIDRMGRSTSLLKQGVVTK